MLRIRSAVVSECDAELESKYRDEGGVCTCDKDYCERWICLGCTKFEVDERKWYDNYWTKLCYRVDPEVTL